VLASGNPSGWGRFLDPTFGSAGTVSVDSRSGQIAVQPDGKVVVTALAGDVNNYAFALARYNADGSPDLAFGRDGTGRIVTDVTPVSDHPAAVAIAPGGQILVAGTNGDFGTSSTAGDFLLVRYTPDGLLDNAFGNGGVVVTDVAGNQDIVSELLPQPDGKVVLAGYDTVGFQGLASPGRIVLARYGADGSLDGSFGSGGIVLTDFPDSPSDRAQDAALQPDGGIVVLARIATSFASSYDALIRYTAAGVPDATFGGGPVPAGGVGVVVAPGGRILVRGGAASPSDDSDFAVFAFNPDGSVDRTFGRRGQTQTNFGTSSESGAGARGASDVADMLAVAPDGSILVAGTSDALPAVAPGATRLALARYDADGKPDLRFGDRGRILAAFGPDQSRVTGLAVDVAGNVVAAVSANSAFTLARFVGHDIPGVPSGHGTPRVKVRRGTLRVRGTNGADDITVSSETTGFLTVTVDGLSQNVAAGDVRRIVVSAGAGDDVLTLDTGVSIPARLLGGPGNDTFFSRNAAVDRLLGGPGADAAQKDDRDVARSVESLVT